MVQEITQSRLSLYEQDYQLWLMATARQLSERQFDDLDIEHLLEEVLELGRRDKRRLESLLTRLWEHLLKLRYWEAERIQNRGHWEGEITNFRVQIKRELKVSPSLQRYLEEVMGECYGDARRVVARRAELPLEVLPEEPISTLEELLSFDWFSFSEF
ncbi:DUF29 domain-containing protein [Prochlorothrix hollandica]|uniref:DUF29 domain-containing protein n=1 Tax=Prochlorothrix hollandica PCC 9006 = CALU 1027 TaxID=317619 RepID=A0A0M2PSP1_PROHO|nr:DUF29 domain-containing protein [Prochlorothrix hollandica]KKI99139.1 hypothetical protein PROH_15300 [Prochlorothrix hollandica PCC 9006 = CALU 1027]